MQAFRPLHILGVPLDLGARTLGVELGPDAIRVAGLPRALQANRIPCKDYGNAAVPALPRGTRTPRARFAAQVRTIAEASRAVAARVGETVAQGAMPLVLGGDHSASIGSVAGVFGVHPSMSLLWIDAHPDATTPQTSLSKNIHGMPLALALGYGASVLRMVGPRPLALDPKKIVIFGAKDIDPPEEALVRKAGVRMITMREIVERGVRDAFREALAIVGRKGMHHHVSFDLDVVDVFDAPGAAIASRGGLTYREIRYLMETLGAKRLVDSLDVVELNPRADHEQRTARLAVEMIIAALGGRYTDYEEYMASQLENRSRGSRT